MIEYKIYEGNSGVELSDVLYSKDKVIEKYNEIKTKYEKIYRSKTFEKYYDIRIKITKTEVYSYDDFIKLGNK